MTLPEWWSGPAWWFLGTASPLIILIGVLFSRRMLFAAVAASASVCFSECVYWYKEGFGEFFIADRVQGYFFPMFFCLWAISAFRVRRLAPLFLCAAIYGYIVEGVIVWIIYEGGLFNWFSWANTPLNWHAPFSVVFGLILIRKGLMSKNAPWLAAGLIVFGLFWGVFTTYQWTPDTVQEWQSDEDAVLLGRIPTYVFSAYAFMITFIIGLAHWLLGKGKLDAVEPPGEPAETRRLFPREGAWISSFKPNALEKVYVFVFMAVWFVTFNLPHELPAHGALALLKFPIAIAIILIALSANKAREKEPSILESLRGPIPARKFLILALLPIAATFSYGLMQVINPPYPFIRKYIFMGTHLVLAVIGLIVFVVCVFLCFWPPYYRTGQGRGTQ